MGELSLSLSAVLVVSVPQIQFLIAHFVDVCIIIIVTATTTTTTTTLLPTVTTLCLKKCTKFGKL